MFVLCTLLFVWQMCVLIKFFNWIWIKINWSINFLLQWCKPLSPLHMFWFALLFPSLEHTLWFIIACMTTKTIEVSDMVSLQCNFFVRLNLKRTIWYEGFDPDSFLSNVIDLVTQNAFMETSLLFILYVEVNKIC